MNTKISAWNLLQKHFVTLNIFQTGYLCWMMVFKITYDGIQTQSVNFHGEIERNHENTISDDRVTQLTMKQESFWTHVRGLR